MKYLYRFICVFGLVIISRVFVGLILSNMPYGFGVMLAFAAPFLLIGASICLFFVYAGATLFYRSLIDLSMIVFADILLFWVGQYTYNVQRSHLATAYTTPKLETPSAHHKTAVYSQQDGCGYEPWLVGFDRVVCDHRGKFETWKTATPDECKSQNVELIYQTNTCFLPTPSLPIKDALVSYEVNGDHNPENPTPLAMSETFKMPPDFTGFIITEIIDGKERVLGRSIRGGEYDLFLDAVFGFPALFGGKSMGNFDIAPPGMNIAPQYQRPNGPFILQALQSKPASH